MPLHAYFEELEPQERRRAARRALKLGVGPRDAENGNALVTILDLSLTGALLETSMPMLVGAIFEFELPVAGLVEAEVVWCSGEYYGCQFSLPIAPAALSAALLQSQPQSPQGAADPVAELRELNAEVEQLSLKMERALKRVTRK